MSHICSKCGKSVNILSKFSCRGCGKVFCKDCVNKISLFDDIIYKEFYQNIPNFEFSIIKFSSVACQSCADTLNKLNEKINIAWKKSSSVKIYNRNYHGKIPKKGPTWKFETTYYKDRDYALNLLKAVAAFHGYNLIYDVYYDKSTNSKPSENGKGTYYYSVFKYSGIAAHKKLLLW